MKRGWILLFSVFLTGSVFWAINYLLSDIIGISVGAIGVAVMGFLLVYFWWAPNNLFFTFVPEGRAKAVVRGDKFDKILMEWRGHKLDDDGNVVELEEGEKEKKRFFGGLRRYGLWPIQDIYVYPFQWTGVQENGKPDRHPEEWLDFILLKDDIYWTAVESAEDKDLLPLNLELLLTIRVENPYKALFVVQNWLEAILNRLKPLARDRVTQSDYKELIVAKEAIGEGLFEASETLRAEEFSKRYGIKVRKIEVQDINPPDEIRKETLAKFSAERQRERILVEADAEAQRIDVVYKKVRQFKDVGRLIRILEALEKSPAQGAKWVLPLPGAADFLGDVFKGRSLETISSDEFKELKEMVEELLQKKE